MFAHPAHSLSARSIALAAVLALVSSLSLTGFILRAPAPAAAPPRPEHWFFRDFHQYWTFSAVVRHELDPYCAASYSTALGLMIPIQNITYCPPWLETVFAPFWSWNYPASALALFAASAALLPGIAWLAWNSAATGTRAPIWIPLLSLAAFPSFQALFIGQISVLIAAAAALHVFAISQEKPLLTALTVPLLALKPHFLAFLAIPVVCRVITSGNPLWLAAPAAGMAAACLSAPQGLLASWLDHLANTAPPLTYFEPATLGSAMRRLFRAVNGADNIALGFLPSLMAGAVAGVLCFRRPSRAVQPQALAWLSWASVAGAPYVWSFDMVLLLIPLALAAASSRRLSPTAQTRWLAGVALFALVPWATKGLATHFWHFFWIPWALAPILLAALRDAPQPTYPCFRPDWHAQANSLSERHSNPQSIQRTLAQTPENLDESDTANQV